MIKNALTLSSLMALGAHKFLKGSSDPILLLKTEVPISTEPPTSNVLVDTSYVVDKGEKVTGFIEPDSLLLPLKKTTRNKITKCITVGRSGESDIIISDKTVSKNHGWFVAPEIENGMWSFFDGGSTNGTSINLNYLPALVKTHIRSGDEIHFGNVRVMFLYPDDAYGLCKYVESEWERAYRLGLPKIVHADTIRLHGRETADSSFQKISL